jgi:hypothetical protein
MLRESEWKPGTHIPPQVAAKIAELIAAGVLGRQPLHGGS